MLQVCYVVRENKTRNNNTQMNWNTFLHLTNVMLSTAIVTYEQFPTN